MEWCSAISTSIFGYYHVLERSLLQHGGYEKRLEGLAGYREQLCVNWNAAHFAKSLMYQSWSVESRLGHVDSIFSEKLLNGFLA